MHKAPTEQDLQLLASDVYRAFDQFGDRLPDIVQFNRNGEVDVNIRGIWNLEERVEFYHLPLAEGSVSSSADLATSPESNGAPE